MNAKGITEYVVGFAFNERLDEVVLLRKRDDAPEHLAGRLNGPGGKVEGDEYPIYAMVREFHEETGVYTHHFNWHTVCIHHRWEQGRPVILYVYAMRDDYAVRTARTVTDEIVSARPLPIHNTVRDLVPHLSYHLDQSIRVLRGEIGVTTIYEAALV